MKTLPVSVVLALALALALLAPRQALADLPLEVPADWSSVRQEGARVVTPKAVPAGKAFTIVVPDLVRKLGSVRGLLDAARASLGEVGTFKPVGEPGHSRNPAGWEYEVLMGPLEKDGRGLIAAAIGLRKGDDEGIVLVIADSVETMQTYSDALTAMLRSVCGGGPAPRPAGPASAAARKVDLRYRVPAGWTAKDLDGAVLLEHTVDTMYDKHSYRVVLLPSEPLADSLRRSYLATWASVVVPSLSATTIAPLPLVRRLKSGAAVAYDTDSGAKTAQGDRVNGGLYLVARGKRYAPILVFFYGGVMAGQLETDLTQLLESAEIPGAGTERVALFTADDLVGDWSESSSSIASYVTPSGGYAGDASIATASTLVLKADRSFQSSFAGVTSRVVVREKDAGRWAVDDARLVQSGKQERSYTVLGVGADAKAGAFLVLGTYANVEATASFCNPRGAFQGTWFRRKE